VTGEQRYLAKRAVHGLNYGMGYVTFAKECGIDQTTAKRVYNAYFATFPRLRVWHMTTKGKLQKSRVLVTPFGRKRIFFNNWGDQMLKEGLAFVPQSTVADIVNQGIIKLHKAWDGDGGRQMLLQVHDSVLVQVKPELVHETVKEIRDALTYPLEINGRVMTIPVDFKLGHNWSEMEKYNHESTYQSTSTV
jgi:DNA polymerase I-like protein with 3'-5' exonuclease and polymerase domains